MPSGFESSFDLYSVVRNIDFRLRLDELENESLVALDDALARARMSMLGKFKLQVASGISDGSLSDEALAEWLDQMTLAVRVKLAGDMQSFATEAAQRSLLEHADILSVGGVVPGVVGVALAPEQIQAFFADTPIGGKHLGGWVDSMFDRAAQQRLLTEMRAGALVGEGYPQIVDRLDGMFGMVRSDAITLARTYIQGANVEAAQAVYAANADILEGWKWCATLETGFRASGHGTCLVCASLDGRVFPLGEGPPIPRHPRCRCVSLPAPRSWESLGFDLPEIKRAMRPWAKYDDLPIDEGMRRTIKEHGFHDGDYGTWLERQGQEVKLNALGPKRLQLVNAGKATLADFVDTKGELVPLSTFR